jgi:hypothetical protein
LGLYSKITIIFQISGYLTYGIVQLKILTDLLKGCLILDKYLQNKSRDRQNTIIIFLTSNKELYEYQESCIYPQ